MTPGFINISLSGRQAGGAKAFGQIRETWADTYFTGKIAGQEQLDELQSSIPEID